MIKRFIAVVLVCVMGLSVVGCGGRGEAVYRGDTEVNYNYISSEDVNYVIYEVASEGGRIDGVFDSFISELFRMDEDPEIFMRIVTTYEQHRRNMLRGLREALPGVNFTPDILFSGSGEWVPYFLVFETGADGLGKLERDGFVYIHSDWNRADYRLNAIVNGNMALLHYDESLYSERQRYQVRNVIDIFRGIETNRGSNNEIVSGIEGFLTGLVGLMPEQGWRNIELGLGDARLYYAGYGGIVRFFVQINVLNERGNTPGSLALLVFEPGVGADMLTQIEGDGFARAFGIPGGRYPAIVNRNLVLVYWWGGSPLPQDIADMFNSLE